MAHEDREEGDQGQEVAAYESAVLGGAAVIRSDKKTRLKAISAFLMPPSPARSLITALFKQPVIDPGPSPCDHLHRCQ